MSMVSPRTARRRCPPGCGSRRGVPAAADHSRRRRGAPGRLRAVVPELRRPVRAAVGARPVAGWRPDYTAAYAPTPHPLQTAAAALAMPFGERADQVLLWVALLSFGALVWLVYRLGRHALLALGRRRRGARCLHPPRPAARRAARLPGRPLRGARRRRVLLEARRPGRWPAVLAVLALAGLIRPEAWLLSGLYVAWRWRAGTIGGRGAGTIGGRGAATIGVRGAATIGVRGAATIGVRGAARRHRPP